MTLQVLIRTLEIRRRVRIVRNGCRTILRGRRRSPQKRTISTIVHCNMSDIESYFPCIAFDELFSDRLVFDLSSFFFVFVCIPNKNILIQLFVESSELLKSIQVFIKSNNNSWITLNNPIRVSYQNNILKTTIVFSH